MKTITIRYSKDGAKSTMETAGFTGGACVKDTARIKEILGEVVHDEKTAEFYACDTAQALQHE